MIGKVMEKRRDGLSSFRDLIRYVAFGIKGGKVVEKIEAAGACNILGLDTAVAEMEACAVQNVRCDDPAFHYMLSWREGEVPSLEQVKEAVRLTLSRLGLSECMAVWGLHNDTDCFHVHVAVNRIHPDSYRAIDPGKGWSKNELEKACREVEIAQGWPIENSGKFTVDQGKIVWKKEAQERASRRERRVGQVARDVEVRTGQRSAERIAIEDAAPIILAATSWSELHQGLAAIGVRYTKKGSGAVLEIGEVAVKASAAHRSAGITQLVKRLGKFEAAPEGLKVKARSPEAISHLPEYVQWPVMANHREQQNRAKKTAREAMNANLASELSSLWAEQRAEWELFFSKSWVGQRDAMNAQQSFIARRHAQAEAELKEAHTKVRKAFADRWRRVPTFRETLAEIAVAPELGEAVLDELRYRGIQAGIHGGIFVSPQRSDVRDFLAEVVGRGVAYRRSCDDVPAFVDFGKKIQVRAEHDPAAILAALQVAAKKWKGKVALSGPDHYKQLAARIAVAEGIQVLNPELQPVIAQEKDRIMAQRRFAPPKPASDSAPGPC